MLRMSEHRNAVKLGQAVGQRRFGHFDYDANKAIGPEPVCTVATVTVRTSIRGLKVHAPKKKVDPITGRFSFSQNKV